MRPPKPAQAARFFLAIFEDGSGPRTWPVYLLVVLRAGFQEFCHLSPGGHGRLSATPRYRDCRDGARVAGALIDILPPHKSDGESSVESISGCGRIHGLNWKSWDL